MTLLRTRMSRNNHVKTSFIRSLIALSIFSFPALASEHLSAVASEWPPYALTKTKPYSGIDMDLTHIIGQRLGQKIELKRCSFKRCLAETEVGSVDIISGIAKNKEREQYLTYTDTPYSHVEVVFLVRKGEASLVQNYEDLYKFKVGTVVKSEYFEPFNSDPKINRYQVSEEAILLHMLANKRIDVIIGTNPNIDYQTLKLGYSDKFETVEYNTGVSVPIYYAISKKSPHTSKIGQIDQIIKELIADGQMERIHSKYK